MRSLQAEELTSVKLPGWWKQSPSHENKTKSMLNEQRKRSTAPDISYDLDGDGQVSCRDFVLAKLFDVDKDGKLNEKEKANALEAIKNGIENEFFWNAAASDSNKQFRLLQKRGVVVEADDFGNVANTYPEHPIHKEKPLVSTKVELEAKRRRDYKDDVTMKMNDKFEKLEKLK